MTAQSQVRANPSFTSKLWIVWIAFCLFVNFDIGAGFYSSQILLVICAFIWTVLQLYKFSIEKVWILLSFTAFTLWSFLIENSVASHRFLPEFAKVFILALSFVILVDLKVESFFDSITLALPLFTSVLTLFTRLFGDWNTYDPLLSRLGVPQLGGSPNTAAYVFAFCMLMCHYQWGRRRTFAIRCVLAASFLILVYGMLASQSRGGLFTYLAGSLFLLKPRWRIAVLIALGIVLIGGLFLSLTVSPEIARFNVLLEARDTGGTGRAIIWAQLFTNLLRDPIRILWGNGPGAIDFYLLGIYPIKSAHSVYVEVLYSYGLIGIIILVAWLAMLRRNANSPLHEPARRQINSAIWFAMVIAFALDSDPPAAQILWLTPLLGALLIPSWRPLPSPIPQASSHDLLAGRRALDYPEASLQQ
jgi:hypothetical protein